MKPSKFLFFHPQNEKKEIRGPLEDCDTNSSDSGYGSQHGIQFAEPCGLPPRRMSMDFSPTYRSQMRQSAMDCSRSPVLRSLSDSESIDDGYNDLVDMESVEKETPSGLSTLIRGSILEKPLNYQEATTPEFPRGRNRRGNGFRVRRPSMTFSQNMEALSKADQTPPLSRARSCLFRSPNSNCSTSKLTFNDTPCSATKNRVIDYSPDSPYERVAFKRPDPPGTMSPVLVKRPKTSPKCEVNIANRLFFRQYS